MKRIITRILLIIIALIIIGATIAYFFYKPDKPWFAFAIACFGGILVLNLLFSVYFIRRNFKDKNFKDKDGA